MGSNDEAILRAFREKYACGMISPKIVMTKVEKRMPKLQSVWNLIRVSAGY